MSSPPSPDPFATGALRSSVLRAWRDSPTRFTEDTNAERDLRAGGYRDRLFVELAQNAADAAAASGEPGRIRVSVVDGELRVANTGAPLDAEGVAALASLRASGKREGAVGRFGVGFAAVLAVTSAPRVVSRTGGVAFSEDRTRAESGRDGAVPILRLPWPVTAGEPPVPEGFDTEVRLPLRTGTQGHTEVLDRIRTEVPDLLLALPWLAEIDVDGEVWRRSADGDVVELTAPDGQGTRWLTHSGEACVWAVPVDADGVPRPVEQDVLHTPTPTDERLSLPARLLASVPVEPSRRRVLAGTATRDALAAAARAYPGLVRSVAPRYRLALVPRAGFPMSEVDTELRELVTRRLAEDSWLPAASGAELPGERARVLGADEPRLTELLADVLPGLVAAPLCGPEIAKVLASVGASTVGVAELVEAVTGITREPSWWHALYAVLFDAVERHAIAPHELGALPVPLADGRTVPGPRGALLVDDPEPVGDAHIVGLHIVHPDAVHPLLRRLGATLAGPGDLLAAPALREAVERSVEDALSGVDVLPLVETVLRLAGGTSGEDLGALALPARDGWRRADELVLPESPLLDVLDPEALGEEAPLDVLDAGFARRWPDDVLTGVGVLDTFVVVDDEEPSGPDHDLPDEDEWWDSRETPPARVLAVRDLDLVADDAWPATVRLLAARPETWRALSEPEGHTRWWLARAALLEDRAPGEWRLPEAEHLAGLYEPVPDVGLPTHLLEALGVRRDLTPRAAEDAEDLCARLADPDRVLPPGLVLRAHAALAGLPPEYAEEVDPPARVRALDGSVADAADAAVLDAPWLTAAWQANRLVALPGYADAPALAELFDLPLAGDVTTAEVTSEGELAAWRDLPAIGEVADLLGVELPDGGVVVHEKLTVGAGAVPWWFDGALHAADTSEGLARAFAWAADRWAERLTIEALLDDPDPRTLLT
ncbi:sacsin N-terminal ATP-binding-like domain-containing protein [Prauserella endophytica]|uniref:Molecular chaperone Hsp90 n=1 Tax=Prauserella endophytica TaxID=1592324 RepID=A0ABY2S158_9PSEU|nr:molecular chaperone Hsp90 [Prauserella endophytica]PXY37069.1 molecular chaperone Hsp90 [Prauserella coralliicola]TKG68424.1 molecular chaperone Hsp90 [Prauserella endophytica]